MASRNTPPASPPPTEQPRTDTGSFGSPYEARFAQVAAKVCEMGGTDQDIAEALGVSLRTVGRWRRDHEEFATACKVNKDLFDDRVELSLAQRALGYSCPDTKVLVRDGKVYTHEVTKHYPPDTLACIYWLNNRRPANWRQKVEIDANVRPADVSGEPMSPDDWDRKYGNGAGVGNGASH